MNAEEKTVMALRLAKAGYWNGDPERVMTAKAEWVLAALQYEMFMDDYERTYIEINREDHG